MLTVDQFYRQISQFPLIYSLRLEKDGIVNKYFMNTGSQTLSCYTVRHCIAIPLWITRGQHVTRKLISQQRAPLLGQSAYRYVIRGGVGA